MISVRLSPAVYDTFLARPFVSSADWCARHVSMPTAAKTRGKLDLSLFPHAVEWFACFDDPDVEKITIQAAAQIGKTIFSQACLLKVGATDPHPMAFSDADERSSRRVLRRTWEMIELCDALTHLCPPRAKQASDRISLPTFEIQGCWSGSPSTASDFCSWLTVLNETDKMKVRRIDRARDAHEQSASAAEADFRKLMLERGKGYGPGAKVIQISTPNLKGGSWIEAERLDGDNRRREVPCPFCNHFQKLRTGNGKAPGGLRFDKRDGKLDRNLARETAWYECEKCQKRIGEEYRLEMCQSGLWVPEGCHVDRRGKVVGKPARPGPHASFGPLSTLHSLLPGISWGRVAYEWVSALTATQGRREAIRNYTNSWAGETWDPQPPSVRPSELVARLGTPLELRRVPGWAVFLTEAADVGQIGDEYIFYWWVSAWGKHGRGHCVDLGITFGEAQYAQRLLSVSYPRVGGGLLKPSLRLVDSGYFTQAMYQFCAAIPACLPIKGSSKGPDDPLPTTSFIEMFQLGFQKAGIDPRLANARRQAGMADLIIPNTDRSQGWIEERLGGHVKRTDPGWYSIPEEVLTVGVPDQPGLEIIPQLIGDFRDEHGRWLKRIERQDLRDAWRISMVAAWVKTKNGRLWAALTAPPDPEAKPKPFEEAAAAAAVKMVGHGVPPSVTPGSGSARSLKPGRN